MSKRSLHQHYGIKWSACQLASILVNIGLLIYSHIGPNGVIYSTINFKEPNTTLSGLTDACINPTDLGVWNGTTPPVPTRCNLWNNYFGPNGLVSSPDRECPYPSTNTSIHARQAVLDFLFLYGMTSYLYDEDPKQYLQAGSDTEWGFTPDCTTCMLDQVQCIVQSCAASCAGRLAVTPGCSDGNSQCGDCVENTCLVNFWSCSGIEVFTEADYEYRNCPDVLEEVDAFDGCYDLAVYGDLERYEMFVIRFTNAISEAFKGGAAWLAVVIILASGAWPYLKDIFMLITWFVPMSSIMRRRTLRWLARLGRWSLVDVYAITLIVGCLRIDKDIGGELLVVRASSDSAIYCFTIAALWALVQGDVIRKFNRSMDRVKDADHVSIQSEVELAEATETPFSPKKLLLFRAIVAISGITAIALLLVGSALVGVKVEIGGFIYDLPGANSYEYSILNVGEYLIDNCQLAEPREFVLVIAFYMLTYVFPIISLVFYVYMAIVPLYALRYRARGYTRVINTFTTFAALDVFFFSMIVLIAQFEPLVDGSLGEQSEIICGTGYEGVCIQLKGTLQSGSFIVLGSVIATWICFYFSTYVQKGHWKLAQENDPGFAKAFNEVTGPAYEVHVGDEVEVQSHGVGTVRFIGETEFHKGVIWYGVELDKPNGKNDGSVFDVRYFSCPESHGLFVEKKGIRLS